MTTKTHGESIYVWSGVPISEHHIIDCIGDRTREKRLCYCDPAPDEVNDVEFVMGVKKKGLK